MQRQVTVDSYRIQEEPKDFVNQLRGKTPPLKKVSPERGRPIVKKKRAPIKDMLKYYGISKKDPISEQTLQRVNMGSVINKTNVSNAEQPTLTRFNVVKGGPQPHFKKGKAPKPMLDYIRKEIEHED